MTKRKVLITDPFAEEGQEALRVLGLHVVYRPDTPSSQLEDELENAYGLITRSRLTINYELLQLAPALRFIARAGAGLENIDQRELAARNIALLHAGEANADAVAEHALGMLLSLLNHLPQADKHVRQGQWLREAHRGRELKEKYVGLLGFGHTGRAFAQRLQGFECKVCTYDPRASSLSQVEVVSLEELQAKSDIISLHIPLTLSNKQIVDATFLSACKRSFILINTARGGLIDHEALCLALKDGKVCAAALDVLENEVLSSLSADEQRRFDFLRQQDNVLLSPHVAGWSEESFLRIAETLVEKIQRLLQQTE